MYKKILYLLIGSIIRGSIYIIPQQLRISSFRSSCWYNGLSAVSRASCVRMGLCVRTHVITTRVTLWKWLVLNLKPRSSLFSCNVLYHLQKLCRRDKTMGFCVSCDRPSKPWPCRYAKLELQSMHRPLAISWHNNPCPWYPPCRWTTPKTEGNKLQYI
jgi:hypothetical protein